MRSVGAAALRCGAFIGVAAGIAAAQPSNRTYAVRGSTRDAASGAAISGVLVEVRGEGIVRNDRTDDAGAYRLSGLRPGRYVLTALRIGYTEVRRDFQLDARDTSFALQMSAVPRTLATARVSGDTSAIYGVVARYPDLSPIAGARVQVMGADQSVAADSSGTYFVPVPKAGTYFVRITNPGFAATLFPIDVPDRRAVEASRMLDPSPVAPHPALEHLYVDTDERLRLRGMNSAVVPGSEVRTAGTRFRDALQASPAVVKQGLRVPRYVTPCMWVNGVPKPGMTLEMIDVDQVAAVEVYGLRGENSATLTWPAGSTCGNSTSGVSGLRRPGRGPIAGAPDSVRAIVVWLK